MPYRLATAQNPLPQPAEDKDMEKRPFNFFKRPLLLGWVMRVELMISRATIWRPNQLGHTHHMARQEGLEPPTYCLEGSCSIQLSYWRIFMERVMGIEPTRPAWKAGILPLNYTRILREGNKSNLTAFPRE